MRNVSHIPPTSAAAPTFLGKPSRSRRLPGSIGRALGKKAIGRGALHGGWLLRMGGQRIPETSLRRIDRIGL